MGEAMNKEPQGLDQIAISADIDEFLSEISRSKVDDVGLTLVDDVADEGREYYFATQKDAFRTAVAVAIANNLERSPRNGPKKNKWQTPAVCDDRMRNFLEVMGFGTDAEKHMHYKMVELAEAGLRFLKEKHDAKFDLWPYILQKQD
jgi:hypothetical protein